MEVLVIVEKKTWKKVKEITSMIEILPIVRKSEHGIVCVINEDEKLVGIIYKHTLESKITN